MQELSSKIRCCLQITVDFRRWSMAADAPGRRAEEMVEMPALILTFSPSVFATLRRDCAEAIGEGGGEKEQPSRGSGFAAECPANSATAFRASRKRILPLLGGEGRGEGEPGNHLSSKRFRISGKRMADEFVDTTALIPTFSPRLRFASTRPRRDFAKADQGFSFSAFPHELVPQPR